MKYTVASIAILTALNAAAVGRGLICREDNRLLGGPLREIILTSTNEGFTLQSHFIPSLNATGQNEVLAQGLQCKIDDKSPLAFCSANEGALTALVKDVRESLFDSLDNDAKKKTVRHIDISVTANNETKQMAHFAPNQCHVLSSEMSIG